MNCCNSNESKHSECIRNSDKKVFSLPRKYSKNRCINNPVKGFTMRSSCAPYIDCITTKKKTSQLSRRNSRHHNRKLNLKGGYRKSKHTSKKRNINGTKNRKQTQKVKSLDFLYNPDNPKKSFDVYIDKNPNDTIPIHYTTVKEVKETIKKLEKLYKQKKYSHKRIWQVGMILKVRMEAMKKHKDTLYPNAKFVNERYKLANKYFIFLGKRSKLDESSRYKSVFKF